MSTAGGEQGVALTIPSANTFVELAPTTSLNPLSTGCFAQSADGQLQYTCGTTKTFFCVGTASMLKTTAAQITTRLRLADTGTTIATSEANGDTGSNWRSELTVHDLVELAQNDYVSLFFANGTNAANVTIDSVNIVCDWVPTAQDLGGISAGGQISDTITIAAADTFVEVTTVTSANALNTACFSQSANGRLQYTCAETKTFLCLVTASLDQAGGTQLVLRLRLGDNGTSIATSESNGDAFQWNAELTSQDLVQLSQNEFVSGFVANGTNANNISLETFNITCR